MIIGYLDTLGVRSSLSFEGLLAAAVAPYWIPRLAWTGCLRFLRELKTLNPKTLVPNP